MAAFLFLAGGGEELATGEDRGSEDY